LVDNFKSTRFTWNVADPRGIFAKVVSAKFTLVKIIADDVGYSHGVLTRLLEDDMLYWLVTNRKRLTGSHKKIKSLAGTFVFSVSFVYLATSGFGLNGWSIEITRLCRKITEAMPENAPESGFDVNCCVIVYRRNCCVIVSLDFSQI
jgi:hypothetical protein